MKNVFFCIFVLTVTFTSSVFAQVKPEEFLRQYGYLKEKTGNKKAENPTPEEIEKAILKYQKFNGLPETGRLDPETEKTMKEPRCAVKDINDGFDEYNLHSKWPKNVITWKIHKYSKTSKLSPAEQTRAILRGLKQWSQVTPLAFLEAERKGDIDISFERLFHGDANPFDGKGNVLAHAFYPQIGDTHFDDDENWINGERGGIDLETVAAHEFGHALGLRHSENPKALMAPRYKIFPNEFKLHEDDIEGIQRLYGKKSTHVPPSTPRRTSPGRTSPGRTSPGRTSPGRTTPRTTTITPTGDKGFCNHSYAKINAAMRISGNDFVFVDYRYVIDGRSGRKVDVPSLFPGGPYMVQAAVYSQKTQKAYLFNNYNVWAYSLDFAGRFNLAKNFPKFIYNIYIHHPESAMMVNYGIERLFLIKYGFFVEFDPYYENVNPGRGYRTRDFFVNIPHQIDATISSNDEVYFISKKNIYIQESSFQFTPRFRELRTNHKGKRFKKLEFGSRKKYLRMASCMLHAQEAYTMPMRDWWVDIRGKPVNLVFNKCQN